MKGGGKRRRTNNGGKKAATEGQEDREEPELPVAVDYIVAREAMRTIGTVLQTCGSLLPLATRLSIDTSLMRYVTPIVEPMAPNVVAATRVEALQAIIVSLCAAHRTQSPLLPHALCAFRAGLSDANPQVSMLSSQGLAVCEALIHPRAPALHEFEPNVKEESLTHSQNNHAMGGQDLFVQSATRARPEVPSPATQMEVEEAPKEALKEAPKEAPAKLQEAPVPSAAIKSTVALSASPKLVSTAAASSLVTTRSSPRLGAGKSHPVQLVPAQGAAQGDDSDSDDLGGLVDADPDDE